MEALKDILAPDEKVIESMRYSAWRIGPALARDSVALVGAGFLIYFNEQTRMFGYAGAALILASFGWSALKFLNNRIWITDRRLISQTGWPGRDILDFPYDRFESAKVEQSIIGRVFDFGDVEISGVGTTVARLRLVASPLRFKRSIEMAKGKPASR